MNQKSKKLWQLVMLLAIDLALLALISTLCMSRAQATRLGSSGERVAAIQQMLAEKGFFSGAAGGEFCPKTRSAVKDFQESVGISSSGNADFETLRELGISSRTALCFTAEAELLARCIAASGCSGYAEMLRKGQEILGKAKAARTLGSYVCEFYPHILSAGEPSSAAYAAALQALREDFYLQSSSARASS